MTCQRVGICDGRPAQEQAASTPSGWQQERVRLLTRLRIERALAQNFLDIADGKDVEECRDPCASHQPSTFSLIQRSHVGQRHAKFVRKRRNGLLLIGAQGIHGAAWPARVTWVPAWPEKK